MKQGSLEWCPVSSSAAVALSAVRPVIERKVEPFCDSM